MPERNTPLVSIITCFYNEERFLKESVESVLKQDYPHWELLLIDDGSRDASSQMARELAARHPDRIFYHEHEGHGNLGLSASRNSGIARAKGEFVAFLDADDVWLPGKLSHQVSLLLKYPHVNMLCEPSKYWYSWSSESTKRDIIIEVGCPLNTLYQRNAYIGREVLAGMEEGVYAPPQLLLQLYPLGEKAAPCPSGLICRKKALEQVGGFESHFTGPYQMYEDQGFLSKMYLNGPIYVSKTCNNLYRQRVGSLVQSVTEDGKYHAVRRYYLEWVEEYLVQQHLQHSGVMKLLEKALIPYRQPLLHYFTQILPGKGKKFIKRKFKFNRGA